MKIDAETLKKQVILHLPYVLFLLVFAKLGEAVRLAPGADASQKLLGLSEGFALAFQSMWPGAAMDWLIGFCGAAIMRLAVYLRGKDAKKYRKNVEYGSARWGNKADIAPFMDPNPENNIILTQSEGLMLNGRLPIHVRCLIDEAANIGQIPNLERLMATIRSREISACLVLQAQSQLKALYKDNMDTIIGNCDASLFLGGKEETTLKSWNSLLGKETIDLYNTSVTKGNQESHGQNFQKLGKDMPYLFVKSSVALNLS